MNGAGDSTSARRAGGDFAQPLWLGAESIRGKTVLLHSELGLGDTLLFCRYAREVAALGARVVLEVQPPLKELLSRLEGVAAIVERGAPLPAFDYHCPLMSLPLAFKTELGSVPAIIPYIRSDPGGWRTGRPDWVQRRSRAWASCGAAAPRSRTTSAA